MIKRMSRSEDLTYLRQAIDAQYYLGCGSSRAVFGLGEGSGKVLKLALDRAGQLQNKHEAMMAEAYPDLCAEVYGLGRYIIVMEYLEVADSYISWLEEACDEGMGIDEYHEWYCEEHKDDEEYKECDDPFLMALSKDDADYDTLCQMARFADRARDCLCCGADCYQIGFNSDGEFRMYDFGFSEPGALDHPSFEVECEGQIGDIGYYLDGLENSCQILEIAIGRLINGRRSK